MKSRISKAPEGPRVVWTLVGLPSSGPGDAYGWPAAIAHQDSASPPSRGRGSHGRSRDQGAGLYTPVHLGPLPPHHRKASQPVSEREAPGEGGPAAQGRQRARLAGCAPLRLRLRELLPPAVPDPL